MSSNGKLELNPKVLTTENFDVNLMTLGSPVKPTQNNPMSTWPIAYKFKNVEGPLVFAIRSTDDYNLYSRYGLRKLDQSKFGNSNDCVFSMGVLLCTPDNGPHEEHLKIVKIFDQMKQKVIDMSVQKPGAYYQKTVVDVNSIKSQFPDIYSYPTDQVDGVAVKNMESENKTWYVKIKVYSDKVKEATEAIAKLPVDGKNDLSYDDMVNNILIRALQPQFFCVDKFIVQKLKTKRRKQCPPVCAINSNFESNLQHPMLIKCMVVHVKAILSASNGAKYWQVALKTLHYAVDEASRSFADYTFEPEDSDDDDAKKVEANENDYDEF